MRSLFKGHFQQKLAIDSKAFWSQKNIYVGSKYCFDVRSACRSTQERLLCLCSNYHKSLCSSRWYLIGPTFLFLRLSIRCRSCIFHPWYRLPHFPLLHFQRPRIYISRQESSTLLSLTRKQKWKSIQMFSFVGRNDAVNATSAVSFTCAGLYALFDRCAIYRLFALTCTPAI